MKFCKTCLICQDMSMFSKDTKNKDLVRHVCKKCESSDNKKYKTIHSDNIKKYNRAFHFKRRQELNDRYLKKKIARMLKIKESEIEESEDTNYLIQLQKEKLKLKRNEQTSTI